MGISIHKHIDGSYSSDGLNGHYKVTRVNDEYKIFYHEKEKVDLIGMIQTREKIEDIIKQHIKSLTTKEGDKC